MKKILVITVALLAFYAISDAGSIIMPFWQDLAETYGMFCIYNSATTPNTVGVMFYSQSGAASAPGNIERTIGQKTLDIFGTSRYPGDLKQATSAQIGYAVCYGTGGALAAIGLVYDGAAASGYPINCFGGDDDGVITGW